MANYNLNAILSVTNRFTPQLNQFKQQMSNIRGSVTTATNGVKSFNNTVSRTGSQRSQVASLANTYRQAGMSASQAFRRAWQEIRSTNGAINQASVSTSNFMSKIKGLTVSIGGLVTAKKLLNSSDEQSNLTARLNLMNDGLQTTEELQNKIFEASERSRGSYTETANMVAKLGINAKDAFSSSSQIVNFAENMNKLFKAGGAGVAEQQAGMLQLTQALASGRLQGDEFRSITENAPELMGILAEKLGKTRAELREMSTAGELTSDVIINAVLGSTDKINEKFGSIPKTWGDVWTDIKNTTLKAITPILNGINWIANNVDFEPIKNEIKNAFKYLQESGVIDSFKDKIKKAFDYINSDLLPKIKMIIPILQKLMPVIVGVASAFLAFKAINTAVKGIKALGTVISFITSPIGLIVIAIGALVAGIIYAYKHNEKFREIVNTVWEKVKGAIVSAIEIIKEKITAIKLWLEEHKEAVQQFKNVIVTILGIIVGVVGEVITTIISLVGGIIDFISDVISIIISIFEGDWSGAWDKCKEVVSKTIDKIKEWWNGLKELLSKPIDMVVNLFKKDQSEGETLTNAGHNAKGTNNWRGGLTWVNEEGGELMNLPSGTQIIPHDLSETMVKEHAKNIGNGMSINIPKLADTIVVREDADIDRIGEALANKINIARLKLA